VWLCQSGLSPAPFLALTDVGADAPGVVCRHLDPLELLRVARIVVRLYRVLPKFPLPPI
jgi:hypothetical protein